MCPQRKVIRFKQTHQPNTASFSNTSLPLFGRFLKKIYDEVKTRNVLHFHKVTKLPPCNPSIVDKSTILQFLFSLLTDSNYGPLRRVCVCACVNDCFLLKVQLQLVLYWNHTQTYRAWYSIISPISHIGIKEVLIYPEVRCYLPQVCVSL